MTSTDVGESDGEFDEMTFTGLLKDAEDAYAWLKSQSCVDVEKIILSGQSMGWICGGKCGSTYSAVRFGSDVSGSRNVVWMQERADYFKNLGMTFADMEGLRFGLEFNYDLAKYSPFEDAKGYEGSVLILRGTKDELVDDKTCETYMECYTGAEKIREDRRRQS